MPSVSISLYLTDEEFVEYMKYKTEIRRKTKDAWKTIMFQHIKKE